MRVHDVIGVYVSYTNKYDTLSIKGLTDLPRITKAITPPARIRVNIAFIFPFAITNQENLKSKIQF